MSKKIVLTLALISAAFLIVTIGCTDKSDTLSEPQNKGGETSEFFLLGIEDGMNSIEDATLDKDMGFAPAFGKDKFPRKDRPHRKGFDLLKLFFQLNLTDEQKESIKEYFVQNHECMKTPFAKFHEAAKEIMEGTREERKEIHDRVKSGEISREQGKEEIRALNEKAREDIKNCEECVEAREEICECNKNLLDNISSTLDTDQLTIWKDWLNDHPTPCS